MDLKTINWGKDYPKYIKYLQTISDAKYQEFNSKIISTKYKMLGIRMPILKKIANDIYKGDNKNFLKYAQDNYYEEVLIKGLVLAKLKNLDELMSYFYKYLDLIDNWAITDTFCNSLKIVNQNKEFFWDISKKLINSTKVYHIRVGLVLLLNYYVEEEYIQSIVKLLDEIQNDEYYVNMAMAWLVCEIFIKFPDYGMKYLKHNKLNKFTINKSISKIRDSYRVSDEIKKEILQYKK